jgi:DNA-binding NtrC family response regulator
MTTNRRTIRQTEDCPRKTMRVLLLEELPGDAELVEAAFQADGFENDVTAVQTAVELDAALSGSAYDVVVTGAVGTGRDPFAILRSAWKRRPEIPVVFLSGSSSQELAVLLLKAGACDFVSKYRVIELVPAVDRALWEAAGRRERAAREAALVESEKRYRSMVGESGDWSDLDTELRHA